MFPFASLFQILSSFIPVVHASSFPILIRISGRLTTVLLPMRDITFTADAIAVSRDDRLICGQCIIFKEALSPVFGNFIKARKLSSYQINFKTNDIVLL